jgi:predicted heme/steroid binding protein
MRHFASAAELAADMKIDVRVLEDTFGAFNRAAEQNADPLGRLYFTNMPWRLDDNFFVALIEPVFHYTMGGLRIQPDCNVIAGDGQPIAGLFACGEVAGGIHGVNRLGGSSLLDCVVFGRVAGVSAARFHLSQLLAGQAMAAQSGNVAVKVFPDQHRVQVDFTWDATGAPAASSSSSAPAPAAPAPAAPAPAAPAARDRNKVWTAAEVAKHHTKDDIWVIVNGQVLDVTNFLSDHPGGAQAILAYAGRDATEQFNLLHKPDVVDKYAPDCVIGVIQAAKL